MKIQSEVITSRQNPTVKWAASLLDKKYREEHRTFIAEGEKLTFEAAEAGLNVTHIFVAQSKYERIIPRIRAAFCSEKYESTHVCVLSDDVFSKISSEKAPQGVISAIKYLDFFRELDIIYKEDFFLKEGERAIALCSVRDPGNLGSVIRSAVAFGVEHVVLTSDCIDVYNPKTVRSAMGSLFRVKITSVRDFSSFISSAKENGRRVFAAELSDGASALDEISISPSDVFVIGNEGHGIPSEVSEMCSGSVYIPISKKTESLNASVAAAIFMWEIGKK
ncbi:MAG: RNA methyltransferase [Clostridia bacterium]|nr:RNA methyltransferase [Clostridia bacterium]